MLTLDVIHGVYFFMIGNFEHSKRVLDMSQGTRHCLYICIIRSCYAKCEFRIKQRILNVSIIHNAY